MHVHEYLHTLHCYLLVLVNFSADSYSADVDDNFLVVNITIFGSYDYRFHLEVQSDSAHFRGNVICV